MATANGANGINYTPRKATAATRLECSKCGATANAACSCGVSYVPAGTRAAAAIARNPEKSDRAIAAEIAVGSNTVRRARKSTAPHGAVGKRVGRDGKARKLPSKSEPRPARYRAFDGFHQKPITFATKYAEEFNAWYAAAPKLDSKHKACLIKAFARCSEIFEELAAKLED